MYVFPDLMNTASDDSSKSKSYNNLLPAKIKEESIPFSEAPDFMLLIAGGRLCNY